MSKRPPLLSDEQLLRFAKAEDRIAVVKRGHNMLELALRYLLYAYLPRPSESVWDFKYDRLLALSDSLGLVTSDEAAYLRYIHKIRDESEHEYEELTTEHDAQALILWAHCVAYPAKRYSAEDIQGVTLSPFMLGLTIRGTYNILVDRSERIERDDLRLPDNAATLRAPETSSLAVQAIFIHLSASTGVELPDGLRTVLERVIQTGLVNPPELEGPNTSEPGLD